MSKLLKEIAENLQEGEEDVVADLVQEALDQGITPEDILMNGLMAGMAVVGDLFKEEEIFVPEVLMAASAMDSGIEVLKPYLTKDSGANTETVCIGTVRGDVHDIGKNLVKIMAEGKGVKVIDLGTDVAPETFVEAAKEHQCKVIMCSTLLTTTMGQMKELVECVKAAGLRDKVKIMVGGAPVTEAFCRTIGADAYTDDAASAADVMMTLLNA